MHTFNIALNSTETAILVKILIDATFSGISLTKSFLRERIHSEKLYRNHLQHFSGHFDNHLQVIQPTLKFPYLISLLKYPQVLHLKYENHLKECNLWLTLKWIRRNTVFHLCLHSDAVFGNCYKYLHVHNLAG